MFTQDRDFVWWKHGIIYQIYPRSFYDSNGDGIGDLPGIISKLDYLSELGIDAIWLSPINRSPMFDFGYDISDYREIDPVFGSGQDCINLIEECHRREIRVILDLVFNHTSHLHPWFVESRSSLDNPKRDWYIWHEGVRGRAPNNWKAAFGGGAWEWDETTGQYYLHSFLREQPDLNWRNIEVRQALYNEARYWLDLGIDGFRLDVVNWFIKDDRFRSNPFGLGPTPRPYDLQKHIYDRNRPEIHDVLKEFRSVLDEYDDRMAVGEAYSPPPGDVVMSASCLGQGNDQLHLSFDFTLLYSKLGADNFIRAIHDWLRLLPEKGWPCHVLSNHDQPRSLTRYGKNHDRTAMAKVLAALLLTVKGTPFIYYGEEIGMTDGRIRRKEIQDPVGIRYWPLNTGRDPARTPMQWTGDAYAGFSSVKPWLPVNRDFTEFNVLNQVEDSGSILNFYRNLIALRRKEPVLQQGDWFPVNTGLNLIAYYRKKNNDRIFVVLNISSSETSISESNQGIWEVIFGTHKIMGDIFTDLRFSIHPYEVLILKKKVRGARYHRKVL